MLFFGLPPQNLKSAVKTQEISRDLPAQLRFAAASRLSGSVEPKFAGQVMSGLVQQKSAADAEAPIPLPAESARWRGVQAHRLEAMDAACSEELSCMAEFQCFFHCS